MQTVVEGKGNLFRPLLMALAIAVAHFALRRPPLDEDAVDSAFAVLFGLLIVYVGWSGGRRTNSYARVAAYASVLWFFSYLLLGAVFATTVWASQEHAGSLLDAYFGLLLASVLFAPIPILLCMIAAAIGRRYPGQ